MGRAKGSQTMSNNAQVRYSVAQVHLHLMRAAEGCDHALTLHSGEKRAFFEGHGAAFRRAAELLLEGFPHCGFVAPAPLNDDADALARAYQEYLAAPEVVQRA